MFEKIFIERAIQDHPNTHKILSRAKGEIQIIDKMEDIWGRVKKPYLQKRETLNLFIAQKKGELVKPTPDAYGMGDENHYYFIHAYNCIYECEYCYLQGYFKTPDIVLFVNHDDIINEMQTLIDMPDNEKAWFHAGEYSDSLALSHMTGELEQYFAFFEKNDQAKLEIRTKSVNISELVKLKPLNNIYISFTLSSHTSGTEFDRGCPSVSHRLKAIEKLVEKGFMIGIHLDPIIYQDQFQNQYLELIEELKRILPNENLGYISIGVVRFTKDVYYEVQKNYPESTFIKQDLIKSFDGKLRYNRPMRHWMLSQIKEMLIQAGYSAHKIYECMED